jgi:16S rRNA (guanine966-N2)-methyltransferase
VREAIFDILGSRGGVEDLTVVDLFCGSGAMGIEALSRGAAAVTFVDRDPDALAATEKNLSGTGQPDQGSVALVRAELPGWLSGSPHFDLALCDPPYDFDRWDQLLGALRADVAVLESASPVELPEGWMVARSRRYGGTLVTVAQQMAPQVSHGS